MTLWLQPVAGHGRKALLSLQLFAHQQNFIETIPEILHEADRDNTWQLLGIYQGEALIGLAMYGDFAEPLLDGELWLNQILLDCRYQGKGLGKAALQLILARLADEFPQRREVFLSVFAENTAAIHLYRQAGFAFIAIHRKFQTRRVAEDSTRLYGEATQHSMRLSVDGYNGARDTKGEKIMSGVLPR